MKITINGIVKAVQEPKTFASGFTVCDVLIEAGSNIYPVTFKKDDVDEALALVADHPIDWCRWQVVNNYMGRIGLINSGGESKGSSDLADAVRTAVINKRAGGCGLISGRKAFQRPMPEGVELLHAIQDVYLDPSVSVA
jgi:class I fructose-bisphosphate aldolase